MPTLLRNPFKRQSRPTGEPTKIDFEAPVELRAAADTGSGKRPTFRINAYSGGALNLAGFEYPVVSDLDGMTLARPKIPIIAGHDMERLIGQADSVEITPEGVTIEGTVTGDDEEAQRIVSHAKNGFEWQASIGANILKREFVAAGQTVNVNGRDFTGPVIVARKTRLFETSFVPLGADEHSAATIAAQHQHEENENQMPQTITATEADRIIGIQAAIQSAGVTFGRTAEGERIDNLFAHAVETGMSVSDVELAAVRASRPVIGRTSRTVHANGSVDREALEVSVLRRAGHADIAASYSEHAQTLADRIGQPSLPEIAASCLRSEHRDVPTDRDELIQAAFTTLSLPLLLKNAANKSLLAGYADSPPSWQEFCAVRSTRDFKTNTAIRPSFTTGLVQVPKDGKISHGSIDETGIEWAIDQFGQVIVVNRVDMINDDLGAFAEALPAMGRAAMRSLSDHIWGIILSASGHFTSGNGNLGEAGSALSIESLAAGLAAIRTQRDAKGNDLDLRPAVLVVSPELEATARGILSSTEVLGTSGPSGNPMRDAVKLAVEPRLSNTVKFGASASATQWLLSCGPADVPAIVGFLDGRKTPTLTSEELPFDQLGRGFRCVFDYGAAMGDYRAAYKATGAAE